MDFKEDSNDRLRRPLADRHASIFILTSVLLATSFSSTLQLDKIYGCQISSPTVRLINRSPLSTVHETT